MSEIERRISEMIRVGVVSEVWPDEGLCRVSFGRRVSPKSKWIALRAGTDRDWWHPDVGEQALYLSPYGDGSEGFVLLGIYSAKRPAPDRAREGRHVTEYGDGTRIEVDREEHRVEVVDSYGSAIRMIDGYIYFAPAKKIRIIRGGKRHASSYLRRTQDIRHVRSRAALLPPRSERGQRPGLPSRRGRGRATPPPEPHGADQLPPWWDVYLY